MKGGSAVCLSLLVVSAACQRGTARQPDRALPPGIDRPITPELLINGRFVAFSDRWSVSTGEGDPIQFLADGRLVNQRAGLVGPWRVIDDSTVEIGGSLFRHRMSRRDLFNPFGAAVGDTMRSGDLNRLGTRIEAASD